ncbi:hypothetical protein ACOMHN_023774 [Nucella lapillus]
MAVVLGRHSVLACARNTPLHLSAHGTIWTARHGPWIAVSQQRSHCSDELRGSVVYIYSGSGTTSTSYHQMHHSLSRCLDHTVLPIGADGIVKGELEGNCAAIVFGGGNTGGFVQALGARGTQMIRNYVLGGGTYVGVCAGAYLASDLVVFRQKGQSPIIRRRPLGFYPGMCVGPVNLFYDPSKNPCDGHHHSVSFLPGGGDVMGGGDFTPMSYVITVKAYVNGGGVFLPPCRESGLHDSRVGQGVAILSSPHLEMTSLIDDVMGQACW